ncbi:alpha/beta fold hydrolase [Cnuibacter sp. UC19_7]|uniref:alpha/beta fold hydrolase n=1 Tax=Cnuibacter sp. UC19_7 TaxID=3350166 RepID=UPI00366DC26A
MANHLFTLASGRSLGVSAAGDPASGRLVVVCHPTPGAGGFDPDPIATQRSNTHIISLDRPGYGASDPLRPSDPTRIEARADDIAEFLSRSEQVARSSGGSRYGRVGVVGWGTGGMVALSLAARRPELVDRVAAVSVPTPTTQTFDPVLQGLVPYSLASLDITDDDPALRKPGLRNRLDRMLEEAGLQGSVGGETDRLALRDHRWTHQLGSIEASTLLVYGEGAGDRDELTTVDDGAWLRRRMPRGLARVVRVRGAGALVIASVWGRILRHVSG